VNLCSVFLVNTSSESPTIIVTFTDAIVTMDSSDFGTSDLGHFLNLTETQHDDSHLGGQKCINHEWCESMCLQELSIQQE
jgi:hypothetical protein